MNPDVTRQQSLSEAFRHAGAGLRVLLGTQRNMRIHVLIAALAVGLSLGLGLSRSEWLLLLLTIGLVFTAEAMNTAIEAVVDLAHPEYHPLAKIAKDVAAAAVLLSALTAVLMGLGLFGPYILRLLR